MNTTITRELARLGTEWVKASDDYTMALLAKLMEPKEKTVIEYQIAKEKFELVDEALRRTCNDNEECIRDAKVSAGARIKNGNR